MVYNCLGTVDTPTQPFAESREAVDAAMASGKDTSGPSATSTTWQKMSEPMASAATSVSQAFQVFWILPGFKCQG